MHNFINEFDVSYRKRSVKRNNTFYFGKGTVSIAFGSEKACLTLTILTALNQLKTHKHVR